MKRQIKFRGKRIDNGEWVYGYLVYSEQQDRYYIGVTEIMTPVDSETVGQFTGLHDKNGKEIYANDLIRAKYNIMKDAFVDAIYKVRRIDFEGLELEYVNLFNKEPDSIKNSYPITLRPCFKYGSLCVDYRNQNYDRLAFDKTYGENAMHGRRWKENHYSTDIEVIGNIHEDEQ